MMSDLKHVLQELQELGTVLDEIEDVRDRLTLEELQVSECDSWC
jgi:hypothetical protein